MTISQILKKSFSITTTQSGLWTLGIFLSSGFNLHWWYLLAWLKQSGIIDSFVFILSTKNIFEPNHRIELWLGFVLIFAICLFGFNLIKLLFFGRIHQSLHDKQNQKCFLCKRLHIEQKSLFYLTTRKIILWRASLASLITIGSTMIVLNIFMYFFRQSDSISGISIISVMFLLFILVGISLWNILTVLFIFWYELSFSKASNLAIDLLFRRGKKIMSLTLLLTLIFLLAISVGSLIIWQLPVLFNSLPSLLIVKNLFHVLQTVISSLAGLLFLSWLVLNNVFFNVAMVALFDEIISGIGLSEGLEEHPSLLVNPAANQAVLHHYVNSSVDKTLI